MPLLCAFPSIEGRQSLAPVLIGFELLRCLGSSGSGIILGDSAALLCERNLGGAMLLLADAQPLRLLFQQIPIPHPAQDTPKYEDDHSTDHWA
jgi:hypothetical protein